MARNYLYADDDVLRGVTLALKKIDRDVKKEWARAVRTTGKQVYARAVNHRKIRAQDKMFARPNVRFSMGGKGTVTVGIKPLSGGLGESGRQWAMVEFGSNSPQGNQLPRYRPSGRVVYGALEGFGPWLGQMAVKTLADEIRDATGGT